MVGETTWIILNTNMEILKMTLCSIGSQCRCLRIGVMRVNFLSGINYNDSWTWFFHVIKLCSGTL